MDLDRVQRFQSIVTRLQPFLPQHGPLYHDFRQWTLSRLIPRVFGTDLTADTLAEIHAVLGVPLAQGKHILAPRSGFSLQNGLEDLLLAALCAGVAGFELRVHVTKLEGDLTARMRDMYAKLPQNDAPAIIAWSAAEIRLQNYDKTGEVKLTVSSHDKPYLPSENPQAVTLTDALPLPDTKWYEDRIRGLLSTSS